MSYVNIYANPERKFLLTWLYVYHSLGPPPFKILIIFPGGGNLKN